MVVFFSFFFGFYGCQRFNFFPILYRSHVITLGKLIGNENSLSESNSVELWFIGQGYEDHLTK